MKKQFNAWYTKKNQGELSFMYNEEAISDAVALMKFNNAIKNMNVDSIVDGPFQTMTNIEGIKSITATITLKRGIYEKTNNPIRG